MSRRVISLFAGVGGFDKGFERAGFEIVAHVEKDEKCRDLLKAKWPDAVALDDVCTAGKHNLPECDVITFGFPCQDLSVAGKRAGLQGSRSGLFYEATRIIRELRPAWALFENVPGLLSSEGGRDFAAVLREMDDCGYCGAWRVLDAQWFGVAQRRRRVFGLFSSLDSGAERCAEILSISESLRGNPAPSREAREGITGTAAQCFEPRSPDGCARLVGDIAPTLNRMGGGQRERGICLMDQGGGVMNTEYDITGTLLSQTKGHEPIVMSTGQGNAEIINGHAPTLNCNHEAPILSYGIPGNWIGRKPENGGNAVQPMDNISPNLTSTDRHAVCAAMQVRRLTPRCCERLQGFQWRLDGPTMPGAWKDEHGRWWSPDWTANFSDSTRYKMMGNAVCVAVSEWIARRLAKNIDEHEGAAQ